MFKISKFILNSKDRTLERNIQKYVFHKGFGMSLYVGILQTNIFSLAEENPLVFLTIQK